MTFLKLIHFQKLQLVQPFMQTTFNSCSVAHLIISSSKNICRDKPKYNERMVRENGLKMNSNKTQFILFATQNFNKRTETFQITIDYTVRHLEDKVKNQMVIFDSLLSFEHHIKSLCSRLNETLSYLNRVKNTLDQKSRILLINALIFSHLNYCSSIWGKCSEILQYEVQKCINFALKVASNGKYLKRDHVTTLLRDLKWINFNSILQRNEAFFMYQNLYVSAGSIVKTINFNLRNKVSQRITRNGSDEHIYIYI